MIGIVDYGLGNTQALVNIYKRLNIPVSLASTPEHLRAADRLVLPGVGAFDWAMRYLEQSGLRPTLDEVVAVAKRPVLGICVGMQMMARTSEEGSDAGLGWIDAEVRRFRFEPGPEQLSLPHMGWNDIEPATGSALLRNLDSQSRFYFLHSYYFAPRNQADTIATTGYGGSFVCAVQSGNCYGVQFHPEKSHGWGIQLLKNFAEV